MSEKTQLIALVSNEMLKKSDAIVCLEGDNNLRTERALELFKSEMAPIIVVSGGLEDSLGSIPALEMADYLKKKDVPDDNIIIESASKNTYDQAQNVIKIVKERKWKRIILVASAFHQPRAFLTFLRAAKSYKLKIEIFNAPAKHPWFEKKNLGLSRLKLLSREFEKIKEYQKKGHLSSIKKAIEYQKWKEKQK